MFLARSPLAAAGRVSSSISRWLPCHMSHRKKCFMSQGLGATKMATRIDIAYGCIWHMNAYDTVHGSEILLTS